MDGAAENKLSEKTAKLDPYILLAALVQATGDDSLLDKAMPFAMDPETKAGPLPDAIQREIDASLEVCLVGNNASKRSLSSATLRKMVDLVTGTHVPDDYVPMLLEESAVITREEDKTPPLSEERFDANPVSVAIIGGGIFGIAAGIYLKKAGIPFVIYEKNEDIGGTWFDNRYPGCGVDTTSHFYVFSFALNPKWPRYFSKQQNMLDYLNRCVDEYGLREHIRFGTSVTRARYDEDGKRWNLTIAGKDGEPVEDKATAVISCVGQLNVPAIPGIEGLDRFSGPVVHTARWRADTSHVGKRVGLLGTGASAVQVGPTIAPEVDELLVFQRSPQWLSKRPNYHLPVTPEELWAFANVPNYINWHRLQIIWQFGDRLYPALLRDSETGGASKANDELRELFTAHIRSKLAERPDLLEKALPDYPPLAKRVPVDFGWFDMLKRDNVRLITQAIDRVEADGIITTDGQTHELDMIVLATGFQATRLLQNVEIVGRNGAELQGVWHGDDARAYLGMTVPGYPNFFIMYGPNTNLGHGGSLMFQAECQARYIASALKHLVTVGAGEIECREEIFENYNDAVDAQLARTVWNTPGVNNWFKNSKGRIVTNSPWSLVGYWERTRHFDPADFNIG